MNRLDLLDQPTWLTQPGDRLVAELAKGIRDERVFGMIFGDAIEAYQRFDFGVRDLPALRIWGPTGRKEAETWYLSGEIKLDVIFPPSIRRAELQAYPDIVVAALLSQLRRQSFFGTMRAAVPGLNRLGWTFSYDKQLGFMARDSEEVCPLTQIVVDYRINLNEWDQFLESDDRTTEDPFVRTLGDLERLVVETQAMLDDGSEAPLPADRFNVKP